MLFSDVNIEKINITIIVFDMIFFFIIFLCLFDFIKGKYQILAYKTYFLYYR
jgi:hypothetical protein